MYFLDILALIAALRIWMLGWQFLFLTRPKTPYTEQSSLFRPGLDEFYVPSCQNSKQLLRLSLWVNTYFLCA